MSPDCVFCRIVAGESPAALVASSPLALAFMDLRQPHPGHVLVIPRAHLPDLYDLNPATGAEMMELLVRVSRAVRDAFAPDGTNTWASNGAAAGQEVFHLHFHIFPRMAGDGLLQAYPGGPPGPTSHEQLAALAARIREKLGGWP